MAKTGEVHVKLSSSSVSSAISAETPNDETPERSTSVQHNQAENYDPPCSCRFQKKNYRHRRAIIFRILFVI